MIDSNDSSWATGACSTLPCRPSTDGEWQKFVALVPRDRDVKGEDALQSFLLPTVMLANPVFPQALDRYEPVAVLGAGGSSVCVAVRYRRQMYCAKIMSDRLSAVDMEEEVHNHQQANDVPGILKLHTAFRDKGFQVVVMIVQLCQADLLDYMKQLGHALPTDEHSTYVFLLSMGVDLYILHRVVGLLHSDVKPDNFLVELVDGWPVAVLGDLGFARRVPENGRKPKHVAGTPGYVAPEKSNGEYEGEESDMWALGITFYAALTGKLFEPTMPYSYVDFPDNVNLSKEMRILLRGMLAYDKDMRPSWELFFMSPAFSDSHFTLLAKKKPEMELFIAAFLELRADLPAQRHFRRWRKQVVQFYQRRRTAVERSHLSLKPRHNAEAVAAALAAVEDCFPSKPVRHVQSSPATTTKVTRQLRPTPEASLLRNVDESTIIACTQASVQVCREPQTPPEFVSAVAEHEYCANEDVKFHPTSGAECSGTSLLVPTEMHITVSPREDSFIRDSWNSCSRPFGSTMMSGSCTSGDYGQTLETYNGKYTFDLSYDKHACIKQKCEDSPVTPVSPSDLDAVYGSTLSRYGQQDGKWWHKVMQAFCVTPVGCVRK